MDGRKIHGNGTSSVEDYYYEMNVRLRDSCTLSMDLPSVHGYTHYIHGSEDPRFACNILCMNGCILGYGRVLARRHEQVLGRRYVSCMSRCFLEGVSDCLLRGVSDCLLGGVCRA